MKNISTVVEGKRKIIKKPELLAPAGNLEKLKVAILYGADAVFIGGKEFSLRSSASNFSLEDIKEAVEFANEHHAKIHVTCNIILHEENLEGLEEYLKALDDIGVYAIIVADPYILETAKRLQLKLQVHMSTQLSILNSSSIQFFENMGAERAVLARETSYDNLKKIRERTNIELEYFIHGAMCVNYSGRCMLSNYFSRRDANRGGCSQSCRWYYDIYKDGMKLNSDDDYFSMSSKDMCLCNYIPDLIELGIDSFKIEGRMKSLHYIATIVSTYRKLIDHYCEDPDHFKMDEWYRNELSKAANRDTCTGFFNHVPDENDHLYNLRDEHPTQEFVIRVVDYDEEKHLAKVEQRNYFKSGDCIEVFSPVHDNVIFTVSHIYNEDLEEQEVANHPMEILYLSCDSKLCSNDMGRKVKK